jgi:transcriptional regulator with XRE-family HTH domain
MGAHPQSGTLGTTIRARRQELGWSQEELAERVSAVGGRIRQSDVSRLEKGKVTLPHPDRLATIAETLGVPLGELLARSGWTGAEAAFGRVRVDGEASVAPEPEPEPRAVPTPEPVAEPTFVAQPMPAEPTRPPVQPWEIATPRLRAAILRARETEARTVEVLAHSVRVAESVSSPRRGPRRG